MFDPAAGEITIALSNAELTILVAFEHIKISDYWNYRQCATRISLSGLSITLNFKIGDADPSVSVGRTSDPPSVGPTSDPPSVGRMNNDSYVTDETEAADEWPASEVGDEAGSTLGPLSYGAGSGKDELVQAQIDDQNPEQLFEAHAAETQETQETQERKSSSTSKLHYKICSFEVETAHVERNGVLYARHSNWGITSTLIVRIFKRIVNTLLKSESLRNLIESSINTALLAETAIHSLFHKDGDTNVAVKVSAHDASRIVKLQGRQAATMPAERAR